MARRNVMWAGCLSTVVIVCAWMIARSFSTGGRVWPGRSEAVPLGPLKSPSIVIEKAAHRLTVYDGEKPVTAYRAAFGRGRGDKVREGDRRTPEGQFYVCLKNPRSRFVLSLGLSYPNVEDAARGLRDGLISRGEHDAVVRAIRDRRQPPWHTDLGRQIMIHGGGSRRDWTIGCIALDDDDIRQLYPAIPLGTPVRIVP